MQKDRRFVGHWLRCFAIAVLMTMAALAHNANAASADFILRNGTSLVDGSGRPFHLRGVVVSLNPNRPPDPQIYREVRDLDLNSVRFLINGADYTGDKAGSGFQLLDLNVTAAKEAGLRVIIMMASTDGAQFVPDLDDPYDYSIWSDAQKQEKLERIWRSVARRYRDDPAVMAFSLFLEPVTGAAAEQWHELAARLQKAVRAEAPHQLLLLEAASGENRTRRELSGIELDPSRAYPPLVDANAAWEFYHFELDDYTHQFAPWRPEPEIRRERIYPDPQRVLRVVEERGPVRGFVFDRTFLANQLDRHIAWTSRQDRPVLVWGFGTARRTFHDRLGGAVWVRDMLELLEERGLGWSYWAYDTGYFGIRGTPHASLLRSVRKSPQGVK